MDPIPVLFLEPTLNVGGAERALFDVVTLLDRERFKPIVCCLKGPGSLGNALACGGVTVYHDVLSFSVGPSVLSFLVTMMRREKIQVVHTINQPLNVFWAVVAGRIAGVPVQVTTVHSTRTTVHARRGRWINLLLGPSINAVVALSNSHRDYLVAEYGMNPAKIHVIHNGIDLKRFQSPTKLTRREAGIPEGVPVAAVLAVLRPEKAHDNFLRAATKVLQISPDAHFAIIGDGPERGRLERLSQDLGLTSRVHFLGFQDHVEEVLPLIDVSVLPSRNTETFPLSILESMAASRPVVVTDVGSLRDIVIDGETGIVVAREDVDALASAMGRLLNDNDLAIRMGSAGGKRAEQFDARHMVRGFETLFSGLVDSKMGSGPTATEPGTMKNVLQD